MRNVLLTLLHLAVGGREAVWSRWRASRDRGESPPQAATDRPAPCSPPGAQPDVERPPPLRIHVALSHSGSHSEARDRPPPVDAAGITSGVSASQVPAAVRIGAPVCEEARTERAG